MWREEKGREDKERDEGMERVRNGVKKGKGRGIKGKER